MTSKYKIILSDCHLSAGRYLDGHLNPYEDFQFDQDMMDLIHYYSQGEYGEIDGQPVEVELVIAGDFFDFLNVPIHGEFEAAVTEQQSVQKLEIILKAHSEVMQAIRDFAALPGKTVTYLIGNHDADLVFQKVRDRIQQEWDPSGEKVAIIGDRDRIKFEGGVEVRHGNQLEAGSEIDFDQPVIEEWLDEPVLNMPWSSLYVLHIINRLKQKREFIDKVRPVKLFIIFGLLIDTWFTLQFLMLSIFYFFKTRVDWGKRKKEKVTKFYRLLRQETKLFLDLEEEAEEVLSQRSDLKTLIMGHTHYPMNKIYPSGKQYINTGTWTRMIHLDYRGLGRHYQKTYAWVKITTENRNAESQRRHGSSRHSDLFGDVWSECKLKQWQGYHHPEREFFP